MADVQQIIEQAFENRAEINPGNVDSEQVMRCLDEADSWEVPLDDQAITREVERAAATLAQSFAENTRDLESLRQMRRLVEAGGRLTPPVGFWKLQNTYYRWLQELPVASRLNELSEQGAPAAWVVEFRSLGEALSFRLPA